LGIQVILEQHTKGIWHEKTTGDRTQQCKTLGHPKLMALCLWDTTRTALQLKLWPRTKAQESLCHHITFRTALANFCHRFLLSYSYEFSSSEDCNLVAQKIISLQSSFEKLN